jgi:hypothetical protein
MEDESPAPESDPEIAALLDFAPVERKCERSGGWSADNQRSYIAGLARTGNVEQAADALGLTGNGAYQLRKKPDAAEFKAAWKAAVALHARRSGRAPPRHASRPAPSAPEPASEEAAWEAFADSILVKYLLKLNQERRARLAGRVIEADFYVRQLTWLEVALDCGGNAYKLIKELKRGGRHAGEIVATPMSVLLDDIRRAYWKEEGGPERPPLSPLGLHDGEISTGLPMECQYDRERDGDYRQWPRRREERETLAAEAQRAWEEKARADAAAWRARVDGEAPAPPAAD